MVLRVYVYTLLEYIMFAVAVDLSIVGGLSSKLLSENSRSKHLVYIVYRKHQIASSLRMLEEEEEEEEEERLYLHLGGR